MRPENVTLKALGARKTFPREPLTYRDEFTCPKCGRKRTVIRRVRSAGMWINTYCSRCGKMYEVIAGPLKPAMIAKEERR